MPNLFFSDEFMRRVKNKVAEGEREASSARLLYRRQHIACIHYMYTLQIFSIFAFNAAVHDNKYVASIPLMMPLTITYKSHLILQDLDYKLD